MKELFKREGQKPLPDEKPNHFLTIPMAIIK
jgi:hypothetical protein